MQSKTSPLGSRASTEDLRKMAVRLILTIHKSIDWQSVNPRTYWERMPAAFRARAQMATTYGQMLESLRKALSLKPWDASTASSISSIGRELERPEDFRRFCRLIREEGALLAAEARVTIDAGREDRR